MRANVPFFDLSARNSTPICSSKCRQTMENKVTFILVQPFCSSISSNGLRHHYPSSLLHFFLCGRSAFSKRRQKKRFLPPLDKNARRTTSSRTLKRKRTPRLLLPRWWRKSKRGVRSVHYTKVESAIESLLSRKAALYSGSRGENKRYTGVIQLSLGAFSIPASIRNSL